MDAYVESGQAQIVFWPVLNHGDPSLYAAVTAECVAQQDMDAFWELHHYLFENQNNLWSADRDYFIGAAVSVGADQATFESCYDGGQAIEHVLGLDERRRARGISTQPVFDIGGQLLFGSQSFITMAELIEAALP